MVISYVHCKGRLQKSYICFFYTFLLPFQPEDVRKLQEENRSLQIDIQLLARELDIHDHEDSEYRHD